MSDITTLMMAAAGAGGEEEVDPNFNQTVLLLHGDGTDGAQNNTFLDSSTNNFTVTRNGNTTQGTFSPFSVGASQWSNFFDGTGDYLGIASNAALAPGTGDFTIECWVNFSSLPASNAIHAFFQNDAVGVSNNTKFWFGLLNNSGTYQLSLGRHDTVNRTYANWTPTVGVWYFIAVSRASGTTRLFVDGVSQSVTGGSDMSGVNFGQNGVVIGAVSTPYYHHGYISNLRYIVGTALYTATFTPSTEPLTTTSQGATSSQVEILTCQSNRFVDNSSNAFAITANGDVKVTPFSPFAPTAAYSPSVNGGSGYFDGTGDYLSVADNTALDLEAADFCLEAWVYQFGTTATNGMRVINKYAFSARDIGYVLALNKTTAPRIEFFAFDSSGNAVISFDSASAELKPYQWTHIACVRNGSNAALFVNGVRVANSTSISGTIENTSQVLEVGSEGGIAGSTYTGYISGVRIVKNDSVYDPTSTTITIPTAPPTNVTNTSLLCNFTNAGIFDNTGKNVLETIDGAAISTTTKKYGTGSLSFDGTGDVLIGPNNTEFDFGGGDFTIELWANFTTHSHNHHLVSKRSSAGGAGGTNWLVEVSSGDCRFLASDGSSYIVNALSGSVSSTGQWYYIVITRSGNDFKMFIDGVQAGSTITTSSAISSTSRPLNIGLDPAASTTRMEGFIDDLRITKGIARDGTVVPTKAFPNL